MRVAKAEASAEVLNDKTKGGASSGSSTSSPQTQTLEEMEARLAKIEAIKGLEGRIAAVEVGNVISHPTPY
jgi:hypothetical protein